MKKSTSPLDFQEIANQIDDVEFAYDPNNKKFALIGIDISMLVFLWHMLNQSRNDTAVLEYLQQYFNTLTTEDYPKSVEKLLAKFKPDQMELHTIKSKLWKKLDTILEDMKGVIK